MENVLTKKYGLATAISMVVGIVIGSGIFFKQEKIMGLVEGNLILSILAWVIGGAIMIVCAYIFSVLATRYEKVNGIVDYAEAGMGSKYAYFVGWFMTTIYYPTLTAVLSWVSANYTSILFGNSDPVVTIIIAGVYMVLIFLLNTLSPVLSGKFQVSSTIVKLVPLGLVAIVGTIVGLVNGVTIDNIVSSAESMLNSQGGGLLGAVVATAFAYEGWIIATSINAELKDAKKNLPKALVIGTLVVVTVYVLYNIGLAGVLPNDEFVGIVNGGGSAVSVIIAKLFGTVGGTILTVFIVISCLGTCNGLMLGCTRGIYSIAARNEGPKPEMFSKINAKTNMPTASAVLGLCLTAFWLVFWQGNLSGWYKGLGLTGDFLDISELPIVTMYIAYIPIFISMMVKMKDLSIVNRFIMPSAGIVGCLFMLYAAVVAHTWVNVLVYLAVFIVISSVGAAFLFIKKKNPQAEEAK